MRPSFFVRAYISKRLSAPIIPQTAVRCQAQIFKFDRVGGLASLKTTPCRASRGMKSLVAACKMPQKSLKMHIFL